MDYAFNREGFFYALKFFILISIVMFLGFLGSREFETYYYETDSEPFFERVPVKLAVSRPKYQKLAKEESVFLTGSEVKAKFKKLKDGGGNFIFADLGKMKLSYYEKGEESVSFDISSKGKDGSFFETPSGIYSINYKEENHFSTIGKVWMPWSMHFFGNYFIHGWPYYPGGKPVAASFSGGCIRLSAGDAKKLFQMARPGMQLLIYSGSEEESEPKPLFAGNTYFKKSLSGKAQRLAQPKVSAGSYLAADFETGQILFSENEKIIYPIASITKVMTALVASEMYQARNFKITKKALAEYGSSGGLRSGEIFASDELLYPLLLASSNDAAAVFESESREFLPSMNKKAKAMGLAATSFSDASGLSRMNVSTAEELFKLFQYVYLHKKPVFEILGLKSYKLPRTSKRGAHAWANINRPENSENFVAGKVGYIQESLGTFAGVYKLRLSEGQDRMVAIIVLHSRDQKGDVMKISKYLEDNFIYGNLVKASKLIPGKTGAVLEGASASVYEVVGDI